MRQARPWAVPVIGCPIVSRKRPATTSATRLVGFVVGRQAFERISAVEGIRPTAASRARADEFDRRGLSAEERRREIISAHRPKAARG